MASPRPETEPPPTVLEDADIIEGLGIPKASPVVKRVRGKDLSDPTQRAEVQAELTKYSNNGRVNANTRARVKSFLASSTFVEPEAQTSEQLPLLNLRQSIIDSSEERDAAFTQREAQLAEEKAQSEALARAAQPGVGAMESAFDAAQRTGRQVEGQAQLEIPQVDPADPAAQAQAESNRLDQEIAEQQRTT